MGADYSLTRVNISDRETLAAKSHYRVYHHEDGHFVTL